LRMARYRPSCVVWHNETGCIRHRCKAFAARSAR
jgi:hypothetical protein